MIMKSKFIKETLLIGMVLGMACSCATNSSAAKPAERKFSEVKTMIAAQGTKLISDNNPIVLHKMTADPCVLVYEDTVYIYGTNDSQQAEFSKGKIANGYEKINTLNVFCSKDLVNWTDCGEIAVAGKNNPKGAAKWATNSWAPAICTKKIDGKDKFFLYFADSANGIGVLSADSPLGPFVDPIGKALVSRSDKNIAGVHWLFDPAVIVDDDGTGYLYFGGGVKDDIAHPKSGRAVRLGDDMVSLACEPVELDPPYLFEDSGINKINGKYYYSYCSNWSDRGDAKGPEVLPIAVIAYMTSDNPLGPFTFQGWGLQNPGTYFGCWGNNHHWLFNFKGKYYMAYHAQIVEKTVGFAEGGYRNLMINEFKINEDGSWPVQVCKKEGVEQIGSFIPEGKIPAATMHSSKNIVVTDNQTLCAVKDGGYICLKGVSLENCGTKFAVELAPGATSGKITVRADNFAGGDVLAEINVNSETCAETSFTIPAGEKIRNLYIALSGDVELVSWEIK